MTAGPASLASIHPPPPDRSPDPRWAATRVAHLGGGMPAPFLMMGAMLSFQLGAAVATGLFAQVGVPATAFLRNAVGGALLVAFARPSLRRPPAELVWLFAFGVELALMNVAFYAASSGSRSASPSRSSSSARSRSRCCIRAGPATSSG